MGPGDARPVVDALGYHDVIATRLASEVGEDWSRYADDHVRSPAGWPQAELATVE
ncbi:hypothetical protein SSCG_03249 [Streptomyces clavuligerus]|nr:hypothetical protein SSCG_03249 [Streptomyces clavuligerus]